MSSLHFQRIPGVRLPKRLEAGGRGDAGAPSFAPDLGWHLGEPMQLHPRNPGGRAVFYFI